MCQRIGNLSGAGTGYRFVGTIVDNGTLNHESANLSYSIPLSSYEFSYFTNWKAYSFAWCPLHRVL